MSFKGFQLFILSTLFHLARTRVLGNLSQFSMLCHFYSSHKLTHEDIFLHCAMIFFQNSPLCHCFHYFLHKNFQKTSPNVTLSPFWASDSSDFYKAGFQLNLREFGENPKNFFFHPLYRRTIRTTSISIGMVQVQTTKPKKLIKTSFSIGMLRRQRARKGVNRRNKWFFHTRTTASSFFFWDSIVRLWNVY